VGNTEAAVDLARVRREITQAQGYFPNIVSYMADDGRPYVRLLLQTSQMVVYTLAIYFPDTYPNAMPTVYVRNPALVSGVVHQYKAGNICYLLSTMWNPGRHTLTFVIEHAAKWLSKYEVWRATGRWPGAEILH
jgi:hypothetical protein